MLKTQNPKGRVLWALFSSVLSIAVFVYLTLNHIKLKLGILEGKSLCNINSHLNCDAVAMSKYAVLMGIPIATWGAATHLILSLLLTVWLTNLVQNRDRLLRQIFAFASFILLVSVLMGAISAFLLSTYCLFCLFTYVLSFILWICLWSATRALPSDESWSASLQTLLSSQRWVGICIVILVPAIAYLSNSIIIEAFGASNLHGMVQESVQNWKTAPSLPFNPDEGLILQHEAPVKMTIVEFADFLCPHCKAASTPLHDFFESHSGVRVIFKIFPLDSTCNSDKINHGDGLRCELAAATYCAESIEHKGWAAHDYIFEHQSDWSIAALPAQIKEMSSQLGLAEKALTDCMKTSEVHDKIRKVAQEGSSIEGTPTFFVNGQQLRYGQVPMIMEAAAAELGL